MCSSDLPQTTPIDGALVVPLTKHEDSRGWFLEARKESWFRELGGKPSLQTNIVYSRRGVIRGLHFHELGQDDLFFCAQGMVRVVLFDRREDSLIGADCQIRRSDAIRSANRLLVGDGSRIEIL